MNYTVSGEYSFKIPFQSMFINQSIIIKGRNLITFKGESFFLNRSINEEFNPIEYIVLGSGINPPQKTDEKLGNETVRNTCVKTVDLNYKRIILTTNFSAKDVIGATEIGVCNDKVLISHDVFTDITLTEDFLYGVVGLVEVEYIFQFASSHLISGWLPHSTKENVYYVYEPDIVVSVKDNSTGDGYRKVDGNTIGDSEGSFYYNKNNNNLYIHFYDSSTPSGKDILIETESRGEIV